MTSATTAGLPRNRSESSAANEKPHCSHNPRISMQRPHVHCSPSSTTTHWGQGRGAERSAIRGRAPFSGFAPDQSALVAVAVITLATVGISVLLVVVLVRLALLLRGAGHLARPARPARDAVGA